MCLLAGRAVHTTGGGCRGVLAGLGVLQPHGRGLEGLHPPCMAVGVDLEVGLGFVLLELTVAGVCDSALVQALILFPHFGDLKLVGDVIALDFHCLEIVGEKVKGSIN